MPYIHLIALNRTNGQATAYHFSSKNDAEIVTEKARIITALDGEDNKSSVSFQIIPTDAPSYESVVSYNPYFKQFILSDQLDAFVESVHIVQSLDSVDVASYLERRLHASSYKLQKLLYFVYADFLTKFGEPPFRASFVAFENGPVDYDVYKKRKFDREGMESNYNYEEKVLGSPKGFKLSSVIDHVVRSYSDTFQEMNNEAANLTHRTGTPWSVAHQDGYNAVITDDMIKRYHAKEQIS